MLHYLTAGSKSVLWPPVFIVYKQFEGLPPAGHYGWCPLSSVWTDAGSCSLG